MSTVFDPRLLAPRRAGLRGLFRRSGRDAEPSTQPASSPADSPGPASFVLPGYEGSNFWKRHRRLWFWSLGLFAFVYGFIYGVFGTYVVMQLAIPLVVMAAMIVWLLPDTGRAPVRALDRLLQAFVLLVICWPNYLAIALPGMPWITVIRLVAVPLAIVMLVSLSVSSRFRAELGAVLAATPVLWKMLVTFMAIAFVSIAFSRQMGNSVNKFVVAQLYWTLIFFSSCYVFSKPGRAMRFAYLLWIGLLFVALIGLQEWRHKIVPWAGHVPSFLKVDDETLKNMMASNGRAATGIYRVKSVFTTPLGLAEYLGYTMPFLIHFVMTARRAWVRAAALATIPLTFYIIMKTDSRLGVVGFFLSILFYVLAWGALRWRNHRGSIAGPVVVLSYPALFCAFLAATMFVRRLHAMVWGNGPQQASSDARKAQVASGIPKIMSHPWGYGIGQGGETLHFANQAGVLSIDTYWLAVGLEYGVIGFLVYYGMFVVGIYQGGRYVLDARSDDTQLLAPLAITLVNFVIIKSIFSQESNHPIIFAMLGAVAALVYRVRTIEAPREAALSRMVPRGGWRPLRPVLR